MLVHEQQLYVQDSCPHDQVHTLAVQDCLYVMVAPVGKRRLVPQRLFPILLHTSSTTSTQPSCRGELTFPPYAFAEKVSRTSLLMTAMAKAWERSG